MCLFIWQKTVLLLLRGRRIKRLCLRTKCRWQRIMLAGWDWILECIYLVLAIGALAAMVSVVATARDEPIGPWRDSHLNVSINTVVAILSAILTGTCTFIVGEGSTMCSRGPKSRDVTSTDTWQ